MSYKRHELASIQEHMCSPPAFGVVRVASLLNFLCCVFYFVCLRSVSRVPNISSIPELSILLIASSVFSTFIMNGRSSMIFTSGEV